MRKALSVILVVLQIALIIFLCVDVTVQVFSFGTIIIIASIILGLWAILSMRKSRLSMMPEPMADASLITTGPYKLLRHPMYTAVLLFAAGIVMMDYGNYKLIAAILLTVVLLIKLHHEEKMLLNKFPHYRNYMSSTYKLIPYLY